MQDISFFLCEKTSSTAKADLFSRSVGLTKGFMNRDPVGGPHRFLHFDCFRKVSTSKTGTGLRQLQETLLDRALALCLVDPTNGVHLTFLFRKSGSALSRNF